MTVLVHAQNGLCKYSFNVAILGAECGLDLMQFAYLQLKRLEDTKGYRHARISVSEGDSFWTQHQGEYAAVAFGDVGRHRNRVHDTFGMQCMREYAGVASRYRRG